MIKRSARSEDWETGRLSNTRDWDINRTLHDQQNQETKGSRRSDRLSNQEEITGIEISNIARKVKRSTRLRISAGQRGLRRNRKIGFRKHSESEKLAAKLHNLQALLERIDSSREIKMALFLPYAI